MLFLLFLLFFFRQIGGRLELKGRDVTDGGLFEEEGKRRRDERWDRGEDFMGIVI